MFSNIVLTIRSIFQRKPDVSAAARAMALAGVDRQRALKKARTDQLRRDLGLPKWKWQD